MHVSLVIIQPKYVDVRPRVKLSFLREWHFLASHVKCVSRKGYVSLVLSLCKKNTMNITHTTRVKYESFTTRVKFAPLTKLVIPTNESRSRSKIKFAEFVICMTNQFDVLLWHQTVRAFCIVDQDTKDWADDVGGGGGGGQQNSGRRYSCLGCAHRFSTFQVCRVTLTVCKLFWKP